MQTVQEIDVHTGAAAAGPRAALARLCLLICVLFTIAPAIAQPSPGDPCAEVSCPADHTCYQGGCFPVTEDACFGASCSAGQSCNNGACMSTAGDACAVVTCPLGQACFSGKCYSAETGTGPRTVRSGPLTYDGRAARNGKTIVAADLSYVGRKKKTAPATIVVPALSYTGRDVPQTRVVAATALVYSGRASVGEPPSASPNGPLAILPLPTGPRASTYLRLAQASVARDAPIRIEYEGLPEKAGEIALFFLGQNPAKRAAWFYTSARKPQGFVERSANSLSPWPGPWKACIGFSPELQASQKRLEDYADCLDFVLAAPSSLNVEPVILLSRPAPKAGESFDVTYSGFPPSSGRMAFYKSGATSPAAYVFTNKKTSGKWPVRLIESGTYELKIFFEGNALRARMTVEVVE